MFVVFKQYFRIMKSGKMRQQAPEPSEMRKEMSSKRCEETKPLLRNRCTMECNIKTNLKAVFV